MGAHRQGWAVLRDVVHVVWLSVLVGFGEGTGVFEEVHRSRGRGVGAAWGGAAKDHRDARPDAGAPEAIPAADPAAAAPATVAMPGATVAMLLLHVSSGCHLHTAAPPCKGHAARTRVSVQQGMPKREFNWPAWVD